MNLENVQIYPNVRNQETGEVTFTRKNFAGRPDRFNRQGGKHYFFVYVNEAQADELVREGFKVDVFESDNPEYETQYSVKVNFTMRDGKVPHICKLLKDDYIQPLSEAQIRDLDNTIIKNVKDLYISPFFYGGGHENGSAWLNEMVIEIETRGLRAKYRYVDEDAD